MNIAQIAIHKRIVTLTFAFVLLVGGIFAFSSLGRLEDPEFTIKNALVVTTYPGATAREVEQEVTDEIETAVQQLKQLRHVTSVSYPGLSIVDVEIQKQYDKHSLPQIWNELRRKVGDVQEHLPPGAGPSLVNDDFGDVFGVFVAISGDEYSMAELYEYAKLLRRELLLVKNVAKVDIWGENSEVIYVELVRDKMTQFGISPDIIFDMLREKNIAAKAGAVEIGQELIRVHPSGEFDSVEDIESLVLSSPFGSLVRLAAVAKVVRGYQDPPTNMLRINGKRAIGLAISTVPGGNVVTMGNALRDRVEELRYLQPLGVDFDVIALQSEAVTAAIDGFVINLIEAVAIVIVVLLLFMGLRSGLIIGGILVITIAGTFILMAINDVPLERISLGALVIALGMLVDNAIVVVDGTLVGLGQGKSVEEASGDVVKQTAIPLAGATLVAILSFAAIGTSDDSTGEYCRSLYSVLMYSLSLSWVTAVTITPVLCDLFLKPPKTTHGDEYNSSFYRGYKAVLHLAMGRRWISVLILAAITVAAFASFSKVDKSFFPDSTRPQFMVDLWMPRGTNIKETAEHAAVVEKWIRKQAGVRQVATVVGQGAPRFLLTYDPEKADSGYAQLLVSVEDDRVIAGLTRSIQAELPRLFPEGMGNTKQFVLGPGKGGKIQVRISGQDADTIRKIATDVMGIMANDGGARGIRMDWRERVKQIRPVLAEEQARRAGIERSDAASAIAMAFEGRRIGIYREGDELISIVARASQADRSDVAQLNDAQVWSTTAGQWIPLRQIVRSFEVVFVDDELWRRDRRPTVTIHCDQRTGPASILLARLMLQIDALELPKGVFVEYGGEYESSNDAQEAMAGSIVLFALLMVLVVIAMFNSLRQPLIIWLCVPLSMIGVTVGLLVTSQPFGFMALLGLLSLVGMLIKNAIVLIDQIDLEVKQGKKVWSAIIDSGISRVRPVSMAALTTMLGMLPLFTDAFFVAMAVTIVFGLGFATVLTLVVVPVFYTIFFKAYNPSKTESG